MTDGTVKWFDQRKGFGFITDTQGKDYFVHFTAMDEPTRKRMTEGQKVCFDPVPGEKGAKAANVCLADGA